MCKEVKNVKNLFIVTVACGALLVACGGPEAKFIGTYDGGMEMPQAMIDAMNAGAAASGVDPDEFVADVLNANMTMELKKDGVCIITSDLGGETNTQNVTWSLNDEGTEITLKLADSEGSTANANMMSGVNTDLVFVVSDDGKVLTSEDDQFGMKMTYTRQ